LAVALTVGCGNNYRPVVSAINPVGPAGQPTKFAVAVSRPAPGAAGLLTFVDFSGDTVLSTPSVQSDPTYFTLGNGGSFGYVINANGALDTFGASNPTGLKTSDIAQTTLLAGANPVSISPIAGSGAGTVIYIPQAGRTSVAALSSNGPSLLQELTVGASPNYVVGNDSAPRVYALSSGNGTNPGQAAAIETTTSLPTISNTLTVGVNPIYGVMSADLTRAYIVNKGSGTLSVINVQTNSLDLTTPTIPATGTLGLNPTWAVVVPTLAQIVVVNGGDGVHPGSLSVISIPLCNSVTPVTNPNCNVNNPTDAVGFGTVVATVPVGVNPTMVDVLSDGSRAYVVNAGNIGAGIEGSVSVVSLKSNTVTATIPGISTAAGTADINTSPTSVYGHPNTVSVSLASPTGKVYITSSDNKFMTVLRTDTDSVQTHISLQGLGIGLATGNSPQSRGVIVTQP
jgi:DNA-binding beta-propeller fold protein YncE